MELTDTGDDLLALSTAGVAEESHFVRTRAPLVDRAVGTDHTEDGPDKRSLVKLDTGGANFCDTVSIESYIRSR